MASRRDDPDGTLLGTAMTRALAAEPEARVAGVIASATPAEGHEGTNVVLAGTSMLGGGTEVVSVELAGVAATFGANSDTSIEVVAKSKDAAGAGAIVVTSDTGAVVSLAGGFTYLDKAVISGLGEEIGQIGTITEMVMSINDKGSMNMPSTT